jgi:hypothetical protein
MSYSSTEVIGYRYSTTTLFGFMVLGRVFSRSGGRKNRDSHHFFYSRVLVQKNQQVKRRIPSLRLRPNAAAQPSRSSVGYLMTAAGGE